MIFKYIKLLKWAFKFRKLKDISDIKIILQEPIIEFSHKESECAINKKIKERRINPDFISISSDKSTAEIDVENIYIWLLPDEGFVLSVKLYNDGSISKNIGYTNKIIIIYYVHKTGLDLIF